MLKSVFIVAYLTIATIVTIQSVTAIFGGNALLADIGIFLTSAPIMLFIGYAMLLQSMARTSDRLWLVMVLAILGASLGL